MKPNKIIIALLTVLAIIVDLILTERSMVMQEEETTVTLKKGY